MITRTDIINYLIWKQGYRSYLEIGLDDPEPNFTKIRCELKESVDPYDPSLIRIKSTISYYLEAQADRDIRNSLMHLNEGGVVVIHDCLPDCEASQNEDHPDGSWVGTV